MSSSVPDLTGFRPGRTHLHGDAAAIVHANMRQILVDALHDHIGHALAVAHGAFHFRLLISKELGGYFDGNRGQIDHLADVMFNFLRAKWPDVMTAHGMPGVTPTQFLDAVNEISPPTEQEINSAWRLEIAGSEDAMRKMYDGSQRVRTGDDLGIKKVHD